MKMEVIRNGSYKYLVNNEEKIIICEDSFACDYLCLYPGLWKLEIKFLLPGPINHQEDFFIDKMNEKFKVFSEFEFNDYIKIYLVKGIKKDIFIHQNGKHRSNVMPEDIVNNVHIIKKEDFDTFIKNKNNYKEIVNYQI